MPSLGRKMQWCTQLRISQVKINPRTQKTGQRRHIVTPRRNMQGRFFNRRCLLLHGLSLDRHTRPES